MRKEDLMIFIEKLKNPEVVLEYCRVFHEFEPRDLAYIVSRYIVEQRPYDDYFVLAGAKMIILSWNAAMFLKLSREDKRRFDEDILEAYRECKTIFKFLENKRLEELDLSDMEVRELIVRAFNAFASRKRIGSTGASKILHIILPNIFVMWDSRIREAYHKLHSKDHREGSAKCYFEFLKQTQQIVVDLLSKVDEEELWKRHLSIYSINDRKLIETFNFRETVLKMLDECNYVEISLRQH